MSATLTSSATVYKAIVHPEAEGGYWAEVAGLPGCFTQGDTLDELYRNLTEAIACHLDLDRNDVRMSPFPFMAAKI